MKRLRGWRATRDRYRRRYADRASMGKLTFSQLEITPLGDQAALVLGRWRLQRDEPLAGNFTVVLRKRPDGWKIVHDHTSLDAESP